ncbi:MAG TPA: class E sortase [Actinomycetota bacterium]|nr:class E sortase [Actinomycetota bacterium]
MPFRRPSPRLISRVLTGAAIVLALAGIGVVAYPFATDLWAARIQRGLAGDLAAKAVDYEAGRVKVGEPLTQLEIPRLGVDVVVVEGTTLSALQAGAGHYPKTPLPGEKGNVAIAGHRTTYGKPFNRMDELQEGDRVILTTPLERHVYEIEGQPRVVELDDWSVINRYPKRGSYLTLTSCHPEGSADYRIVVRANLIQSTDVVAEAAR